MPWRRPIDEHEIRITRLEAAVDNMRAEQQHHADHHLELSKIASEFRASKVDSEHARLRMMSELKAENAAMVQSVQGIVGHAIQAQRGDTKQAITASNLIQVTLLVVVAGIYIAGEKLGVGAVGIGAAEAAVLGLAAWFVRANKKRPGSTGLSSFPSRFNGKGEP